MCPHTTSPKTCFAFFCFPFFWSSKTASSLGKRKLAARHIYRVRRSGSVVFACWSFFHIFYPQFWYTQTLRRDPVGIGNPVSYQQKGSWCQLQGGSLCDTTCRRLDPNLCRQWQRRKKTTMMMVCYESQAQMIYAPQWCIGRIQIQTLESLLSDIELLTAGCHVFVLKDQSWIV